MRHATVVPEKAKEASSNDVVRVVRNLGTPRPSLLISKMREEGFDARSVRQAIQAATDEGKITFGPGFAVSAREPAHA